MVRSLAVRRRRWQKRLFVAEGARLLEEAQRADYKPSLVLADPVACAEDARLGRLLAHYRDSGIDVLEVAPHVLASAADTETSAGLLALFPFLESPAKVPAGLVLIVDGLADPGNLGAILRSAWAADVAAVFLTPTTVDLYNPKAVRAGMGALFSLPIYVEANWKDISQRLSRQGDVWLAEARRGAPYHTVDWGQARALIVGGEARGAGSQAERFATGRVTIPMRLGVESLNAAVATGVLLFEAYRQRHPAAG